MRKKRVAYTLLALSVLLVYSAGRCWAVIDITATGGWSRTINGSDLNPPYTAGSDLNPTYESSSNAVVIDISGTAGDWAVTVRKEDTWPGNLQLYIKRASDGSCTGTISNGTTYRELTGIDSGFFNGSTDCGNINIQLKIELTGTPRIISPGVYSSTVTYTVTG